MSEQASSATTEQSGPSQLLTSIISILITLVVAIPATVLVVEHRAERKPMDAPIAVLDTMAIIRATVEDPSVAGDKNAEAVRRIETAAQKLSSQGYIVLRDTAVLEAPAKFVVPKPRVVEELSYAR